MLKTSPTSVVVQSRKLVSVVQRLPTADTNIDPSIKFNYRNNMSADVAAAPRVDQQTTSAAQRSRERAERASEEDKRPHPRIVPFFPLGYKDAVYQWWTSATPKVAERNVIAHIPYLREAVAASPSPSGKLPLAESLGAIETSSAVDPYGPRISRSTMVQLSGKNRALNEFSVERVGEPHDDTLVMLHGYGAGLGFFYKNFEPLTRSKGWKLYALDMLGMGNSTRPPWKVHAKDPIGKIKEAEDWFIDALEEWRNIRKLEKFTLLGHSMGGYLAVSYALKYPGRLNKLILASPVGIPEDPYAVNAALPEPEESAFQEEFTQDQVETTKSHGRTGTSAREKTGEAPPQKRKYPGWLAFLWDANVSPFSLVRLTGPLGPRFVSGWTARRFNHLPAEEAQTLHEYAYSLFRQPGSGEYALPYLLAPGAFARRPVINRIQGVGRQVITPPTETSPAVKETGYPIIFMYGENDWMDVNGGIAAEEKLKQAKIKALLQNTADEKRRENGAVRVVVIKKSGHHLYLDNPEDFNEVVAKELEETKKHTLQDKTRV